LSQEFWAVDLHIHTHHSPDGELKAQTIIEACLKKGLSAIAITDHNTIDGAKEVAALASFPVIAGEEILTKQGEITGLFLQETIPAKLTPAQTIRAIREQGGLVYIPHGCDSFRRSTLKSSALEEVLPEVDIIEVLNSRSLSMKDNERARELASSHNLAMGAGSDAHIRWEIGNARVVMKPFSNRDEFLTNLREGRVEGKLSGFLVHIPTRLTKIKRRLFK